MNNGWPYEEMESVKRVLEDISSLEYELNNCVRGAYSRCYTIPELKEYIQRLGGELQDAAEDLEYIEDSEETDEEEGYEDPDFQEEEDDYQP